MVTERGERYEKWYIRLAGAMEAGVEKWLQSTKV
jgi:hypothetical protein